MPPVRTGPQSSKYEENWNKMYHRVVKYKEEHGDCIVPRRYIKDRELGRWVSTQRIKRDSMPVQRRLRLESIGFVWCLIDSWNIMLVRLVQYRQKHGDCLVPQKYNEDPKLARWVSKQRHLQGQLTVERKKLLDSIAFPWLKDSWETMFGCLKKYREEHGDCLVKQRNKEDPKLGTWVNNQRKRQDDMALERLDRLNSIDFVWNAVGADSWGIMFERLVEYKQEHGDCLVPTKHKDCPRLARWVNTQRTKRNAMLFQRRERLDSIGFVWTLLTHESWGTMFERLVTYKQDHSDCLVPSTYKKDPKLGTWVNHQRKRQGIIASDQGKLLDSIGFIWSVPKVVEIFWETMFERLVEYKEEQGDCLVPQRNKEDPKLGLWVSTQRAKRRTMSSKRRECLDSIGFVWSLIPQESWEAMFEHLIQYKEQHGDCSVPHCYKQDPKLGGWVYRQRANRHNMTLKRKDLLDSIGFAWILRVIKPWETMFGRLSKYKEEHGDCLVPNHYKKDRKLGNWVNNQRRKKSTIPPQRKELMNSIAFVWKAASSAKKAELNKVCCSKRHDKRSPQAT